MRSTRYSCIGYLKTWWENKIIVQSQIICINFDIYIVLLKALIYRDSPCIILKCIYLIIKMNFLRIYSLKCLLNSKVEEIKNSKCYKIRWSRAHISSNKYKNSALCIFLILTTACKIVYVSHIKRENAIEMLTWSEKFCSMRIIKYKSFF